MQMTLSKARTRSHVFSCLACLILVAASSESLARALEPRTSAPDSELKRIDLHRNGAVGNEVTATFAIPFAPGELNDPSMVRILDGNGIEIPASVQETLRWHFKDGSIRSVRVQLKATLVDDTRRLQFDVGRARTRGLPLAPYANSLVDGPHHLRVPGILATLDPRWLTRSLVAGPQQPFESANSYDRYVATQLEWASALPVADSTAWLFDRPSTLFKLYVRSGRIEHLRAAIESYRFYMSKLVRGTDKCAGGWKFAKVNPCVLAIAAINKSF
ncbi:MAG: hypothetical protein ABI650_08870, partial [Dokdonella sp.]